MIFLRHRNSTTYKKKRVLFSRCFYPKQVTVVEQPEVCSSCLSKQWWSTQKPASFQMLALSLNH